MSPLSIGKPLHHSPEVADDGAVILVTSRVVGVLAEVFDIDWHRGTGDEYLELLMIEHAEPLKVDDVGESLTEGKDVGPDLNRKKLGC